MDALAPALHAGPRGRGGDDQPVEPQATTCAGVDRVGGGQAGVATACVSRRDLPGTHSTLQCNDPTDDPLLPVVPANRQGSIGRDNGAEVREGGD